MKKVFIGGSRHIKQLDNMVKERLNNIINSNYQVLLSDASGVDEAVQKYLHEKQYSNVVIYCAGKTCRNNIGKWRVFNVPVSSKIRGRKYFMVKDATLASSADYGFMIWDGKSPGTLNNIFNLIKDKKKALIYYSPEKQVYKISDICDVEVLLNKLDSYDILNFEKKINLSRLKSNLKKYDQLSLDSYINPQESNNLGSQ